MNTLEKIAGIGSCGVIAAEAAVYTNTALNTPAARLLGKQRPLVEYAPLTQHVGDFPESFAVPVFAGVLSAIIERHGKQYHNPTIEKIGRNLPEIATASICTYFTLGESILPSILPGTADMKDIPAVLVSAGAGYLIAKLIQRSGVVEQTLETANADAPYKP